jgi:glycosyltransferase involved in cell wall biosynthesis
MQYSWVGRVGSAGGSFDQYPLDLVERDFISSVIVTQNQLDYTRHCVESVRAHTQVPYELIFVDNSSTDGTVEYLRSLPGATVIVIGTNRGFPAAANQGIGAAKGRQILLLNNDCVVPRDWLQRMLAVLAREPRVGLVGPCSNSVSGPQRIPVDYEGLESLNRFARESAGRHRGAVEETDRLVGFCLLIRREVVDEIGLLDKRFGVGCFEDDSCWRPKWTNDDEDSGRRPKPVNWAGAAFPWSPVPRVCRGRRSMPGGGNSTNLRSNGRGKRSGCVVREEVANGWTNPIPTCSRRWKR